MTDDAHEQAWSLALTYRGMAWDMALSWSKRGPYSADDAFQEAMLALHEAALRFDPSWEIPFQPFGRRAIKMRLMSLFTREKRARRLLIPGELRDRGASRPDLVEEIADLLSLLLDRERHVLRSSFGIGVPGRTSEELGAELGLCDRQVKRIKAKALRKLAELLDGR